MKIQLHGQFETANYGDLLLCILFYNELKKIGHKIIVKNACDELYAYLGDDVLRDGTPDKIVFCGGGYLCDGSLRFTLHMIKRIYSEMAKARFAKIPYAIIGAGSKPYKNKITLPFIKWCLNGADFILVRNEESKNDLLSIGVKNRIDVSVDNVLRIDETNINQRISKEVNTALLQLDPHKKTILIHVNYLPIDGNKQIIRGGEVLIDAIATFANSHDEYNYIVSYDHLIDEFIKQCDQIKNKINATDVVICPGKTVYDVMNIINYSDIVITTKLHVGITGIALYKNVISFPMHIKTERFYKQLHANDHCIMLENCKNVNFVIEMIEKNIEHEINENNIKNLKEKANYNYSLLKSYCSKDWGGYL